MVSLRGKPHARYPIIKQRTQIGRSSENDIVLNSWSVSASHAVLVLDGSKVAIEDLGSKNGTFVAGSRIARVELDDGAVVRVGEYTLTLVADRAAMAYEPTMMVRPTPSAQQAYLLRISGSSVGEVVELDKVVTTLGTPGVCLVMCIRRLDEFAVRFIDGGNAARLNGIVLSDAPVRLNAGDVLEMENGRLRFLIRQAGTN
jgi:hypothetical protein